MDPTDLRGLVSFGKFVGKNHRPLVAYLGEQAKWVAGVEVLPWQEVLRQLTKVFG